MDWELVINHDNQQIHIVAANADTWLDSKLGMTIKLKPGWYNMHSTVEEALTPGQCGNIGSGLQSLRNGITHLRTDQFSWSQMPEFQNLLGNLTSSPQNPQHTSIWRRTKTIFQVEQPGYLKELVDATAWCHASPAKGTWWEEANSSGQHKMQQQWKSPSWTRISAWQGIDFSTVIFGKWPPSKHGLGKLLYVSLISVDYFFRGFIQMFNGTQANAWLEHVGLWSSHQHLQTSHENHEFLTADGTRP